MFAYSIYEVYNNFIQNAVMNKEIFSIISLKIAKSSVNFHSKDFSIFPSLFLDQSWKV